MKTLLVSLTLFASLWAVAHHQDYNSEEILMGAKITGKTIKIQVRSGGCTHKNSFWIKEDYNSEKQMMQLTFMRSYPDHCEGYFPEGKILSFNRDELGIRTDHSFNIGNRFR